VTSTHVCDLTRFVQVQRSGEAVDVHRRGSVSWLLPLSVNRRITNGPDMAPWCSPAPNGVTLAEHRRQPTSSYQLLQLARHYFFGPDRRCRMATAGSIDALSVKAADVLGAARRGFDGGKKINSSQAAHRCGPSRPGADRDRHSRLGCRIVMGRFGCGPCCASGSPRAVASHPNDRISKLHDHLPTSSRRSKHPAILLIASRAARGAGTHHRMEP